jgi:hypothetical protein
MLYRCHREQSRTFAFLTIPLFLRVFNLLFVEFFKRHILYASHIHMQRNHTIK